MDQEMEAPRPARDAVLRLIGGPYDGQTTPFEPGLGLEVPNPDRELYGNFDHLMYAFALDIEVDPPEWVGLWPEIRESLTDG